MPASLEPQRTASPSRGATASPGVDEPPNARARYLAETVRVWLGVADASVEIPELPPELARQVLRLEECEQAGRDQWGCWDFDRSENFRAGRLREPEVDRWLADRRAELAGTTTLEPLWPSGHRFAMCVTHDVDLVALKSTPSQVVRFARAGLAPGIGGGSENLLRVARPPVRVVRSIQAGIALAPSLHETLERAVDVEASRGVSASYFFTVPPHGLRSRFDCVYAPNDRCRFRGARVRIADVMLALEAEGFDVGLHGGYRAALEPGALAAERETLERATGLAVTTTRQHFLRWDVRSTPVFQEEAGLLADSSLGFNGDVGFRAGTSLPFHHFDVARDRALRLLEVPLVVQDGALLGGGGLGLDLARGREVVRRLVDEVAAVGGLITVVFHPDKLARPDWCALFEWTLDYALDQGGWVTSLARLQDRWGSHEARVLGV